MRTLTKITMGLFLATNLSPVAFAHDTLINNGKLSSSAKSGYLFSCQTTFRGRGGAIDGTVPWRDETTYSSTAKPTVSGSVNWPSEISVTLKGNQRIVSTNSLPDHPTGIFPIEQSDDAYQYDHNPNGIQARDIVLALPANPVKANTPSCISMGMVGFALTGAAFYNALDDGGRDAVAYEIKDDCGGHPQRAGQYHYHNAPACITDTESGINGHSDIVGYALDGFGIFGKSGENGVEIKNTDLDECHGHTHTVEWDGSPTEIYHYHLSAEFPYTLGCYAGTPKTSPSAGQGQRLGDQARPARGQGGQRAGNGQQRGNRTNGGQGQRQGQGGDRLAAAAKTLGVSVEALRNAVGTPPPDFNRAAKILGISAAEIRKALGGPRR